MRSRRSWCASSTQSQVESQVSAVPVGEGLFKLRVRIENHTTFDQADQTCRDQAVLHALASTHTILGVQNGEFLSLIDPPDDCRDWLPYAATRGRGLCSSAAKARRIPCCLRRSPCTTTRKSPPESPGEFFDGTEIDEMLVLRILTLTDEEKAGSRGRG